MWMGPMHGTFSHRLSTVCNSKHIDHIWHQNQAMPQFLAHTQTFNLATKFGTAGPKQSPVKWVSKKKKARSIKHTMHHFQMLRSRMCTVSPPRPPHVSMAQCTSTEATLSKLPLQHSKKIKHISKNWKTSVLITPSHETSRTETSRTL
jgi:hypothetical protein